MKLIVKLVLLSFVVFQAACSAETVTTKGGGGTPSSNSGSKVSSVAAPVDLATVKANAQAVFTNINPQYKILSTTESGIAGFYRVQVEKGPTIYMNADASYFFTGDAFMVESGNLVNLSEKAMNAERFTVMSSLKESEMVVFDVKPPMTRKAQVTIFTDVDCYYCQKMHLEVPALNEMGIAVRYMAFPRAGVGSASYNKIVSAWCADDPQTTMTMLKSKQTVANKTCKNPVADQYKLGQQLGVTGTPAILLDDGSLIPGYRPANKLAASLGIQP